MKQETPLHKLKSELDRRLLILNNEPNGIVRETMIQNLLVDFDEYLAYEREVIESFATTYFIQNRHDQQKITEVMVRANIESEFENKFKTE